MEKTIATIEVLKIVFYIIIVVSAFWQGYIIGQQKVYKDLLKKEWEKCEKIDKNH